MPNALTMMTTATAGGKTAATEKPEPKFSGKSDFADFLAKDEGALPTGSKEPKKPEPGQQIDVEIVEAEEMVDPMLSQAKFSRASDSDRWVLPLEQSIPAEELAGASYSQSLGGNGESRVLSQTAPSGAPVGMTPSSEAPHPEAVDISRRQNQQEPSLNDQPRVVSDMARTSPGQDTQMRFNPGDDVAPTHFRQKEDDVHRKASVDAAPEQSPAEARKSAPQPTPGPTSLNSIQLAKITDAATGQDFIPEDGTGDFAPSHELASVHSQRDFMPSPAGVASPARPEVARSIAGQLAAVITAKPGGGSVEIALNPDELGKVAITLTARDDGMHMVIAADRQETLDLMRRHISILSSEFRDLGLGNLSFDLGTSSNAQQDDETPSGQSVVLTAETETETFDPHLRASPNRALDLRL